MVISSPLLAPVPDAEGLVNGCSCSTTSVHFNKPSDQWPSVLVLTGGAKYQFDERGLDHRRIHSKEGWECSIPPAVRHFKLHLHDLRSLSDPNNGAYSACTGRRQEILNQILDRPAGRHTGECRALRTWCEPLSWSHACQRELAEDEVRRPLCLLPWVVRPQSCHRAGHAGTSSTRPENH